jgi:hypothetical protein
VGGEIPLNEWWPDNDFAILNGTQRSLGNSGTLEYWNVEQVGHRPLYFQYSIIPPFQHSTVQASLPVQLN